MPNGLNISIFGLSITSSWGNGHATTFRALVKGLHSRGHNVTFFERKLPWYTRNRDLRNPRGTRLNLYSSVSAVKRHFTDVISAADLVIVGSYVPDGKQIGEWITKSARGVTAFYDIDTPVTLAGLERGDCDYISARLISRYDLYLSFTGGPMLRTIQRRFRARQVRPLYCSVDLEIHSPAVSETKWDLGYMGTYSDDRQPALERLMLEPARQRQRSRMVVAGAQYPDEIAWPANVQRIEHLAPGKHRTFYNSQRFTLNLTREAMRRAGYSPSVRLFEAAACGTPIITDPWAGLDSFFREGRDILVARSAEDTLEYLNDMPEKEAAEIGRNARARILAEHTAQHRAAELECYVAGLGVGSRTDSQRADTSPRAVASAPFSPSAE